MHSYGSYYGPSTANSRSISTQHPTSQLTGAPTVYERTVSAIDQCMHALHIILCLFRVARETAPNGSHVHMSYYRIPDHQPLRQLPKVDDFAVEWRLCVICRRSGATSVLINSVRFLRKWARLTNGGASFVDGKSFYITKLIHCVLIGEIVFDLKWLSYYDIVFKTWVSLRPLGGFTQPVNQPDDFPSNSTLARNAHSAVRLKPDSAASNHI